MLERYFKYPQVLRRLRSGMLGEEMDHIATHLFEVGYKHASAKTYISQLGRFSKYVTRNGGTPVDRDTIDHFMCSLPTVASRVAARTAIQHARRIAPHRFANPTARDVRS